MTEFFYVFLLIVSVLCESRHVDVRLLDPTTLDKSPFEIEDSRWSELPKCSGRNFESETAAGGINANANTKAVLGDSEEAKKLFSGCKTVSPVLNKNVGLNVNLKRKQDKSQDITAMKWRNVLHEVRTKKLRGEVQRGRKKRYLSTYLSAFLPEKHGRFLDYTNSQMPFNEGQSSQAKKSGISGEAAWHSEKRSLSPGYYSVPEALPPGLGKTRGKRFQENFEIFPDDPVLEYSRVRRFLDQERAKKQTRVSSTLEAMEAAMSEVLDPNLNSDGILEPHVRKRRGSTKKRDLSLKLRRMIRLRLKRHKPTCSKSVG